MVVFVFWCHVVISCEVFVSKQTVYLQQPLWFFFQSLKNIRFLETFKTRMFCVYILEVLFFYAFIYTALIYTGFLSTIQPPVVDQLNTVKSLAKMCIVHVNDHIWTPYDTHWVSVDSNKKLKYLKPCLWKLWTISVLVQYLMWLMFFYFRACWLPSCTALSTKRWDRCAFIWSSTVP